VHSSFYHYFAIRQKQNHPTLLEKIIGTKQCNNYFENQYPIEPIAI
jgi:hypothetical protein